MFSDGVECDSLRLLNHAVTEVTRNLVSRGRAITTGVPPRIRWGRKFLNKVEQRANALVTHTRR